ncbi:MAG: response regulator transcription factor [Lachnospiraceae bacterium]
MTEIIVVEDDIYLREEIVNTFAKKGYSVSSISSFDAPEMEIIEANPDLIILDLNLPGKSGFELCKILKTKLSAPILILTACDTLSDELKALGLGADDFLTKPCLPDRLIARAEKLVEIYKRLRNIIRVDELQLDIDTYKVALRDIELVLPETEGKILQILIKQYPEIVSQKELIQALWGRSEFVDENILQVNMTRLRKKLSEAGLKNMISTARGKGYYLEVGQ